MVAVLLNQIFNQICPLPRVLIRTHASEINRLRVFCNRTMGGTSPRGLGCFLRRFFWIFSRKIFEKVLLSLGGLRGLLILLVNQTLNQIGIAAQPSGVRADIPDVLIAHHATTQYATMRISREDARLLQFRH